MNNEDNILTANSPEIKELLSNMEKLSLNLEVDNQADNLNERYLNNKQVCEMLRISPRTLQDYRDKGKIAFYKLEGKILYKMADIEKMLEENYYKAWQ